MVKDSTTISIFALFGNELFVIVAILCICIKLLLIPSYRSTDFEVHRNWLAITSSLNIKEWYFESNSEWTLDYPPFFAYFEYILSYFAAYFDSNMLNVENLNYSSYYTIIFQRLSVVVVDLILFITTWRYAKSSKSNNEESITIFFMIVFNCGLLMVDHIHFQYNGLLLGLLIFCFDCANREKYLLLTATFSILVLMKHLFAPLVIIFGVYLLRSYCRMDKFSINSIINLIKLILVAIFFLAISFLPFLLQDNGSLQMNQILSRLFPFCRGLVHAYWAPNVWAIYCFIDKIIVFVNKKLGYYVIDPTSPTTSSGLVGEFIFGYLPMISPIMSLILTLIAFIPAIRAIWSNPSSNKLVQTIAYASMSSFMLGYHVHEKAILITIIIQTLLIFSSSNTGTNIFFQLLGVGVFSLFPLFTNTQELFTKTLLYITYLLLVYYILRERLLKNKIELRFTKIIYASLFCLFCFVEIIHPTYFNKNGKISYQFLPLMVTSLICSIFLVIIWYKMFKQMMND